MTLRPELLLAGYCQGIFPMADAAGQIGWYEPLVRAIIPLDGFTVPRRLARTVRSGRFEVRIDYAFRTVMEACAATGPGREETWISPVMIDAYTRLNQLGYAHSVETWRNGQLVGGLYGVSIGGLFAGESMFHLERDASKVALVQLVEHLRRRGFVLLDSQYLVGEHMRQFGTIEISRDEYQQRLQAALQLRVRFRA